MLDYKKIQPNQGIQVLWMMKGVGILFVISMLFYRSWIVFCLLLPLVWVYRRMSLREYRRQALQELNRQFSDGLQALNAALHAGHSVECGFSEALKDLLLLYGEQAMIVTEFRYICNGIQMNEVPERLLYEFAERSGLEDVRNFAEVFDTAKRTGGDLSAVILATTGAIRDKEEVEREISQQLAATQFQQKIMNVVPCGILGYVNLTSPEFLQSMYGTMSGVVIMTICLLLYLGGVYCSRKMVDVTY